jgi:hypothetical protein
MPVVVLMLAIPELRFKTFPLSTSAELGGTSTVEPGAEIVTIPVMVRMLSPSNRAAVVAASEPFTVVVPLE